MGGRRGGGRGAAVAGRGGSDHLGTITSPAGGRGARIVLTGDASGHRLDLVLQGASRLRLDETGSLQMGGSDTVVDASRIHRLRPYAVGSLPAASAHANGMVLVTDDAGGPVPAFSDGAAWRRVTDRAVVATS